MKKESISKLYKIASELLISGPSTNPDDYNKNMSSKQLKEHIKDLQKYQDRKRLMAIDIIHIIDSEKINYGDV